MSSPSPVPFALRPATDQDAAFVFAVYASTRRDEFALLGWDAAQAGAFLKMQFDAQQRGHRGAFPQADRSVIVLHENVAAGTLVVSRTAGEIRLVDIALLPAFRGQGVGAAVVRTLLDEASARGVKLRLSVAKSNRAARLYERLGFSATADDGVYMALEWPGTAVT